MTEQGSYVLNVATFVHQVSSKRMAQDVRMRKAFWNNTYQATLDDISYLLASEFRSLLGNKELIGKRDTHQLKRNPMNKKSSAIITKRYYSLLVALANNTDSVVLKVNILYSQ